MRSMYVTEVLLRSRVLVCEKIIQSHYFLNETEADEKPSELLLGKKNICFEVATTLANSTGWIWTFKNSSHNGMDNVNQPGPFCFRCCVSSPWHWGRLLFPHWEWFRQCFPCVIGCVFPPSLPQRMGGGHEHRCSIKLGVAFWSVGKFILNSSSLTVSKYV